MTKKIFLLFILLIGVQFSFANEDDIILNIHKNIKTSTEDVINTANGIIRGYNGDTTTLKNKVEDRKKKIKSVFTEVGEKWANDVNPLFNRHNLAKIVYKSVEDLDSSIVSDLGNGGNIIKLKDNNSTSDIVRQFLIKPFTNIKGKTKEMVYDENSSKLNYKYKTFIDKNTHLNMGVIGKKNKKLQKKVLERMCMQDVCVKNTNGDLIVYPSLLRKQITPFSFLNCSYNEEKQSFENCDANTPLDILKGTPNPNPSIINENLSNKTKQKIKGGKDIICIGNDCKDNGTKKITITNTKSKPTNTNNAFCGNYQLEDGEECDIGTGGWTANTCSTDCKIINRQQIYKSQINMKDEDFFSCFKKGDILNNKKIIDVKYVINNFVVDSNDHYVGTGYNIYILSGGKQTKKSLKMEGDIKYYKVGDYGKYTNSKSMYFGDGINGFYYNPEKDSFDFNISNISKIKVYPDNNKDTKYENFINYITGNFIGAKGQIINKDNIGQYIIKNEIWGYGKELAKPTYDDNNNVCIIQKNLRKINLYKINGAIKTKGGNNIDGNIHLDNVFAIDRLILSNDNIKNFIAPYLTYIYEKLELNNFKIQDTFYTPSLYGLTTKLKSNILNTNFMNENRSNFGTFITNSEINKWKSDLSIIYKNIFVDNSNINGFNNNNNNILLIPLYGKNPAMLLGFNNRNVPDAYWDWEGALTLKGNTTIDKNFTNKIKMLGNLVLMGFNNKELDFENLKHLVDGIYLRQSNKNNIIAPNLMYWNVIKKNSQKNVCSDEFIKGFKAFNTTIIDARNSSNNSIKTYKVRHIGFDKYRGHGYLYDVAVKTLGIKLSKIEITSNWDVSSVGNKVYLSLKPICKNGLGLYKYNDGDNVNSLSDNKYNIPAMSIISKMQKYMFQSQTNGGLSNYTSSISLNKQHIEYITILKGNKKNVLTLFYGISKGLTKTPPFLGQHNERGTVITLGDPPAQTNGDDLSYIAYTPTHTYHGDYSGGGGGGGGIFKLESTCAGNDLHYDRWGYDTSTGTVITSERIEKDSTSCMYYNTYCNKSEGNYAGNGWIEDGVSLGTDYFRDKNKTILFTTSVSPKGCLSYKEYCKGDDKIQEWYKYYTKTPNNLYNRKIIVNGCKLPTVVNPISTTPTKPIEVITQDGATDLIINKNAPIISTIDGKQYGLSDQLWLSYISSNNRKVDSRFAFKGVFYYTGSLNNGSLNDGTDVYMKDKNGNIYSIGQYKSNINGKQGVLVGGNTLFDVYGYDDNHNLWTYGLTYKLFCQSNNAGQCHYNHNDYTYFIVGNNSYLIGTFIDPNKIITLTNSNGNKINIPIQRVYKLFKYNSSNGFWYEIGDLGQFIYGDNVQLNGVTVDNNNNVYIYYIENGVKKGINITNL